jgi:hypothetical protein
MSAKLPIRKEPHPQPLPACGEGRQSVALAGWGSSGLISNEPDMISSATIVVLYILKIGINVYCKYTEPDSEGKQGKNNNS